VGETALRIAVYGLVAGASPLAILSTLAVLTSRRGRINGTALALGFLLGQSVALLIAVLIGSAAGQRLNGSHDTLAGILELLLGAAMLLVAWRGRHGATPLEERASRTDVLLARLAEIGPRTAFSVGVPLGVGAKRPVITLLAGAAIASAGLLRVEELALGALYVLLAGLLVWVPVAMYLVLGRHADRWMRSAQAWLSANTRRLTFLVSLILGVFFLADGVVRLG